MRSVAVRRFTRRNYTRMRRAKFVAGVATESFSGSEMVFQRLCIVEIHWGHVDTSTVNFGEGSTPDCDPRSLGISVLMQG